MNLQEFQELDIDKIEPFGINGMYYGRASSIYDGDTCCIIIKTEDKYKKITCRLYGMDTPELRSHTNEEKKNANISKNILINLLTDYKTEDREYKKAEIKKIAKESKKIILVECLNIKEKYGRILVNIYLPDILINESVYECKDRCKNMINVSTYMIENNYATEYFGGTKI